MVMSCVYAGKIYCFPQPIFNLHGRGDRALQVHVAGLWARFVMHYEASSCRKIRPSSFIVVATLDVTHCDRIAANTEALIAPQKPIL